MIDLTSITIALAGDVGFGYLQHNIALHARRVGVASLLLQLNQTERARRSGLPLHLIAHEDVLVFRKAVDGHE